MNHRQHSPSRQLRYYHRKRQGLVDILLTDCDPDMVAHWLRLNHIEVWDDDPKTLRKTLAAGIKELMERDLYE
jgi:hypothetical protein